MKIRANYSVLNKAIVNEEIIMRCSSLDHTKEILIIGHIITIIIATVTATISRLVVLVEEIAAKGVGKEHKTKVLMVKILLTF